ncbi:hypothetical protein FVEN_g9196 [Fusarium venenatum]|uniref:uncharacterized protein n=1 Tax=Fusarium venenatum TaxID=56646 RepID=UPI001D1F9B5F|nr:hypothetical protein FVEN_g9196 [Fusarium venenatum]KAH7006340.1 hypothetical protein EDB82DRAFT_493358 [Fusarium venenatum]
MGNLSTDAIVTIISTIPGLLVSSLSAWFAYAAIRRRHLAANDIETSTLIVVRLDPASLIASSTAPQLPPVPAVRPQLTDANSPVAFGRPPSQQLDQILPK